MRIKYIVFTILIGVIISYNSGCEQMPFNMKQTNKLETIKDESSESKRINESTSLINKEQYSKYEKQIDLQIAKDLQVDLDKYIKLEDFLNATDPISEKVSLVYIYFKRNILEKGDRKPSVYLNRENSNKAIILLQKSNETNKIYYIQLDDSVVYQNIDESILKVESN